MVGLRLATDLLEVDEHEDVRMGEDVVTPTRPPKLEPEGLDESPHVRERDVREIAASDPRQESPRIHDAKLTTNTDGPKQTSDSCQVRSQADFH